MQVLLKDKCWIAYQRSNLFKNIVSLNLCKNIVQANCASVLLSDYVIWLGSIEKCSGMQSLLPVYKVRNLIGKHKLQIIYLMYNMYQMSKTKST